MRQTLGIVILAAGKGTRMKSSLPKVLHPLAGKPLLEHVIETAQQLEPDQITVVCGNGAEQVMPLLEKHHIEPVMQSRQQGTGHAMQQAIPVFEQYEKVLVLYGDVPLIRAATLTQLLTCCTDNHSIGILTTQLNDPTGYGRIVRDPQGQVMGIVEQKDADTTIAAIKEVNTGIMVMPASWLADALGKLDDHNAQGEYYLTDIVAMAVGQGLRVQTVCCDDSHEVAGVNTRQQLAQCERHYQQLQANALMDNGVTVLDPGRIDIRGQLTTGLDVMIDINVVFEGVVDIGDNVTIGANCVIKNAVIGAGTTILPHSIIEESRVGRDVSIGPFARLRPGTVLADKAKIGNFVETKNARIGQGTKVNHLSYIGDTDMGRAVNIGAGTITCNYDGAHKHKTIIEDNAFIGSNTQLVAPVKVGRGATIGAGTTLRKDAPADRLTLTASVQKTIDNWSRPVKKKA